MKSIFTFNGSYHSFQNFAQNMEGAVLTGNKIEVNSTEVSGSVTRADLEEGLSVIDWKLHIIRDHVFINNFSSIEDEKFYLLTYYMQPAFEAIHYEEDIQQSYKDSAPTLLVMSNSADLEFHYKAGAFINCISVSFTHKWLLQQLIDVTKEKLVAGYLLRLLQSIQLRELSTTEMIYCSELCQELRGPSRALLVKTQIFNLLSFLYRHVSIKARSSKSVSPRADVMIQVEKELVANLSSGMPSLDILARKFYLSPSTLSRHFKGVYGTSVHDYFMLKKMELAKELLRQRKSVNEVAFILGCENVSHFIARFKKTFGHSPGKEGREQADAYN